MWARCSSRSRVGNSTSKARPTSSLRAYPSSESASSLTLWIVPPESTVSLASVPLGILDDVRSTRTPCAALSITHLRGMSRGPLGQQAVDQRSKSLVHQWSGVEKSAKKRWHAKCYVWSARLSRVQDHEQ